MNDEANQEEVLNAPEALPIEAEQASIPAEQPAQASDAGATDAAQRILAQTNSYVSDMIRSIVNVLEMIRIALPAQDTPDAQKISYFEAVLSEIENFTLTKISGK